MYDVIIIGAGSTSSAAAKVLAENVYKVLLAGFLYLSAIEDKDLKLSAFLDVIILHHGLSKKTIAKMAGIETSDVEKLISYPSGAVIDEIKYKVAVTVMALRFS